MFLSTQLSTLLFSPCRRRKYSRGTVLCVWSGEGVRESVLNVPKYLFILVYNKFGAQFPLPSEKGYYSEKE